MPTKTPPAIIKGIVPIVVLVMPTNVPANITSGKCVDFVKCPIAAPISPIIQEETTTEKPYLCNKKVLMAPPTPPRIIKSN